MEPREDFEDGPFSEHELNELTAYQGDLASLEYNPEIPDFGIELTSFDVGVIPRDGIGMTTSCDGINEAPISREELSHVLAALTWFRQCRFGDAENRPPAIHAIATKGGTLPCLTEERLKLLIERLDGADIIRVSEMPEQSLGTRCSVCGETQFSTPHGASCPNGHGGAPALAPHEIPAWNKVQYPPKEGGPYQPPTWRSDSYPENG